MAAQISVTARYTAAGVRITCPTIPALKDRFVRVADPTEEMDVHEAVKDVVRAYVPPRDWPECQFRLGHMRDGVFLFHTLSNLNPL